MKHDEPDEKELEELESRLRKAVAGHKPEPPASLVDFIETVPVRGAARRMGIAFGGLGLWHGFAVAAVSAAVLIAVAGTALLMSIGPDRGAALASGTIGVASAGLGTPSDYVPVSEWPDTSVSPQASPTSSASVLGSSSPTTDPWASPSVPTLPPASRTIAGTVTNKAGQPVAGVTVYAGGPAQYEIKTGGDGRYSLWVVAGTYAVYTWDSTGTYGSVFYGATSWGGPSKDIDVRAGDALAIDMVLPPAIHVTVKVVDEEGTALAGIECRLAQNTLEHPAITNAAGLASWTVQWPGLYFVYVSVEYANYSTPDFTVNETSTDFYFVIVKGSDTPTSASPSAPPSAEPSAS
jgi:hypothetical protein